MLQNHLHTFSIGNPFYDGDTDDKVTPAFSYDLLHKDPESWDDIGWRITGL